VIARQITYDKVTRQMVGLNFQLEVQEGQTIYLPAEDKPGGKLTSVADSPRFGCIALGIVRKSLAEPGTKILAGDLGNPIEGMVRELPFVGTPSEN
jgi:glycine cleavage system aminomethyltransferase T